MNVVRVQDIPNAVLIGWKLIRDGFKSTSFHESDWLLMDDHDLFVGCFPNKVIADEVADALKLYSKHNTKIHIALDHENDVGGLYLDEQLAERHAKAIYNGRIMSLYLRHVLPSWVVQLEEGLKNASED